MKKSNDLLISILPILLYGLSARAQCGVNLLTNGGFESPIQSLSGNNYSSGNTLNGWTTTGGTVNIVKVDGSTTIIPGPPIAQDGNQFLDVHGVAGGTAYQDFSISGPTRPIVFGGYFSSHQVSGYINWTAKIEIYALPGNMLVSTSTTRYFTATDGNAGQGTWYYLYGSTTLAAGTYRYVASVGNYGNFDAAFVNIDCVVPVILRSFQGKNVDDDIRLNWNVEDQSELSHFEIEKSSDAIHFIRLKNISPSLEKEYHFVDKNSDTEPYVFYRLKIVTTGNSGSYSNIIRMPVNNGHNFQITAGPSPDQVLLTGMKNNGWVSMFDINGEKIFVKETRSATLSLNVSSFQHGIYLVQYSDGRVGRTKMFFKQ